MLLTTAASVSRMPRPIRSSMPATPTTQISPTTAIWATALWTRAISAIWGQAATASTSERSSRERQLKPTHDYHGRRRAELAERCQVYRRADAGEIQPVACRYCRTSRRRHAAPGRNAARARPRPYAARQYCRGPFCRRRARRRRSSRPMRSATATLPRRCDRCCSLKLTGRASCITQPMICCR